MTEAQLNIELRAAQADVDALGKDIAAVFRIKAASAPNRNRRTKDKLAARRTREAASVLIVAMQEQCATAGTFRDAWQGQLRLLEEEQPTIHTEVNSL